MSGSSAETEKSPADELLVENLRPRLVDVATTVAPGTTAPEGSVTVPLISPLPASWALAGDPQNRTAVRRTSRRGKSLGRRWRSELDSSPLPERNMVGRSLLSIICNLSRFCG